MMVSIRMPPTRNSDWRDSSETHVPSSDCSRPRSLDRRLVSSPVRCSVKNAGERRMRWANVCSRSVAMMRSVVALSRIHLHEVHHRLHGEDRQQHERHPIERRAILQFERGVEQEAQHQRKHEPRRRRDDAGTRTPAPGGRDTDGAAAAVAPAGAARESSSAEAGARVLNRAPRGDRAAARGVSQWRDPPPSRRTAARDRAASTCRPTTPAPVHGWPARRPARMRSTPRSSSPLSTSAETRYEHAERAEHHGQQRERDEDAPCTTPSGSSSRARPTPAAPSARARGRSRTCLSSASAQKCGGVQ